MLAAIIFVMTRLIITSYRDTSLLVMLVEATLLFKVIIVVNDLILL